MRRARIRRICAFMGPFTTRSSTCRRPVMLGGKKCPVNAEYLKELFDRLRLVRTAVIRPNQHSSISLPNRLHDQIHPHCHANSIVPRFELTCDNVVCSLVSQKEAFMRRRVKFALFFSQGASNPFPKYPKPNRHLA